MANLKALRQKVKNITDYSPELQQFNDQLDELLNDAYYCIWTMKRWNFSTELSTMRLHTDITTSTDTENSSGANLTLKVKNGEREIEFSASQLRNKVLNIDTLNKDININNYLIINRRYYKIYVKNYLYEKKIDKNVSLAKTLRLNFNK